MLVRDILTNTTYEIPTHDVRENSFVLDCSTIKAELNMATKIFKLYTLPLVNALSRTDLTNLHTTLDGTSSDLYKWVGDKLVIQHNNGRSPIFTRFYDPITLDVMIPEIVVSNTNELIVDFDGMTATNDYRSSVVFNDFDMFTQEIVLGTDTAEVTHVGNELHITHALDELDTIVQLYDITANDWIVINETRNIDASVDVADIGGLMTTLAGHIIKVTVVQFKVSDEDTYKVQFNALAMTGDNIVITHGLNTVYGVFKMRNMSTGALVFPTMSAVSTSTVSFDMSGITMGGDTFELIMLV